MEWNYLGRVDGGHGNFQGSKSLVARLRKAQMKTNKSGCRDRGEEFSSTKWERRRGLIVLKKLLLVLY
jgi:hypothetical protein